MKRNIAEIRLVILEVRYGSLKFDKRTKGWICHEGEGVSPLFLEKKNAVSYARTRASFRTGEIHVYDKDGNLEETFPFDESKRRR